MFTPKLSSSRSRLSTSFVVDRAQSDGKKRSNLFTPRTKSEMKMFGVTGNRSMNVSDTSTRSLVENVPDHELVEYGVSLPVLVTETLALADNRVTVKMDPNGWASLVYDCRLIVWNFRPSTAVSRCFELPLPPSNTPNNANLVAVIGHPAAMPSCFAVSPEGVLRYWFNVSLAGSYVELKIADISADNVACQLVALQIGGCILGTTSSMLIMINTVPGQDRVSCRPLKGSQGMLSGIGRRVSSFFFTAASPQLAPLRKLLAGEMIGPDVQVIYVLTADGLQKWMLRGDTEKMLYQCNLASSFVENLSTAVWKVDPQTLPQLKTWLLDMELTRDGVVILGAGVNVAVSSELHYVIGSVHTEGEDVPQSFLSFNVINHPVLYDEEIASGLPDFKLLMPSMSSTSTYIYNTETILCFSVNHPTVPPEAVDFPNLGCGSDSGQPLFFSTLGCLVAIRETKESDNTFQSSAVKQATTTYLESSLVNQETIYELSQSGNDLGKLKAAFLASFQDAEMQTKAQSIVNELFPPGLPMPAEPGSPLDRLVTGLSQEMIDDYPASDPRWAESLPPGISGSSLSLILIHQLDDKLKAHELYLRFLKNVHLWSRLTAVHTHDGDLMETSMMLCEHAEKLEAAKVLHELHTEHTALVNLAIEDVLAHRGSVVPPSTGLTATDVFYREVSKVHDILEHLVNREETTEPSAAEVFSHVSAVNSVIIGMLSAAISYRLRVAPEYKVTPISGNTLSLEFVPWTASSIVHETVVKQHAVTVQTIQNNVASVQNKGVLFQQLVQLTDILLDGYRTRLDSLRWNQQTLTDRYREILRKYEKWRSQLIAPFMKFGEYERAASLAEKYCDFATLVELCEKLDNQDRLQRYMDQFQQNGFADFVFKWYLEAGKRGKLMTSKLATHPLLAKFLESNDNQFMSWIHDIQCNDYQQAHKTLLRLAEQEHQYASKKKTLLSLSKLAALAVDDKTDEILDNIESIVDDHDLLLHQEHLPSELIQNLGIDIDTMRVIPAKELIQMYISEYNTSSTELDFKKALDLLNYIDKDDADRQSLVDEIWCRAILKDEWQSGSTNNPIESCSNTVFYRTLELLVAENSGLPVLFPDAEHILSCESLGDIRHQEEFRFLIQGTIEHIHRQCLSMDNL